MRDFRPLKVLIRTMQSVLPILSYKKSFDGESVDANFNVNSFVKNKC